LALMYGGFLNRLFLKPTLKVCSFPVLLITVHVFVFIVFIHDDDKEYG
jgi:uncharacterized membrane protein YvlD (DUF360 family)